MMPKHLFMVFLLISLNFATPLIVHGTEEHETNEEETEKNSLVATQLIRPQNFLRTIRRLAYELNYPKRSENLNKKVKDVDFDILEKKIDEDDRLKRYDDYGHMRFGKRGGEEQFDDYGHMRFGRAIKS